jgi:4-hydroxyacetophenone monooxygenase
LTKWNITIDQASDNHIREALEYADIQSLMGILMHLNGNCNHFNLVQPHYDPLAEEPDGLTEEQRASIRKLAFTAITLYRDAQSPELPTPTEADVNATMHHVMGQETPEEMLPYLREELNLFGEDTRRVNIDTTAMDEAFKVLIIGSGMSGILAAIRLKQAGVPFMIVDKNAEPSGTWYENTYPGCQVDSVNHLYNYIFEPNHQWPGHFSGQAELKAYFERIIEKYELRQHMRLNTTVIRSTYREHDGLWDVETRSNDQNQTFTVNSVISAVGQLNSPQMPEVEGVGDFAGTAFHSARWEHEHDLSGKRIIVIGTGCSAVQFVPEIAPQCGELKIFQRSPPWLVPTEKYHQAMPEEALWLFREIPFYARWFRFVQFRCEAMDGSLPLLYAEDDWQGPKGTIGEGNELFRELLIESLTEQAGDDKALLAKLIPDYPPGGKRPVLDDGAWIKTIKRDNVQLLTDGIAKIVPDGVVTQDGQLHKADILIYGTGFKANQFLAPMEVIGKNGTELVSQWGGDPQAYMGVVVPQFPNFYCLYGPNSNIVVGSSIVFMVECQMRYVSGCLKLQLENDLTALECRPEVMKAYNKKIDVLNSKRAWGCPVVSSWYKNQKGRVTQNWPGTHWEYWQQLLQPDQEDFYLSASQHENQ